MTDNSDKKQWFKEARLGMFVHWGLYSILGRGEWVMLRDGIPAAEYATLSEKWNPLEFAPEEWCLAAAKAGMKYVVMTTLHHDGFALFDSKANDFNSLHTPARRDHVAEFVTACRKYGLGIGLYYSLNDWSYSRSDRPLSEWAEEMKQKAYQQLRELMTNYGKIDLLWYDGSCAPGIAEDVENKTALFWEAEKLNAEIRKLQPDILINNRSGQKEDFVTLEGRNIIRPPEDGGLWEACLTLVDDDFSYWGYCRSSLCRRTAAQTIRMALHTIEFAGNFLLNISPDPNGLIPG